MVVAESSPQITQEPAVMDVEESLIMEEQPCTHAFITEDIQSITSDELCVAHNLTESSGDLEISPQNISIFNLTSNALLKNGSSTVYYK